MRIAKITRKTRETLIEVELNLDGAGESNVSTGINFLNHMLETLAHHSKINLKITAEGDLSHHIVEDVAITLGKAIDNALGNRESIKRFGYAIIPMDDALALAAIDLSRRAYHVIDLSLNREMIEDMASEDILHFFQSLSVNSNSTMHIKVLYGFNDHHKVEAAFKALARALHEAVKMGDGPGIPSIKGVM